MSFMPEVLSPTPDPWFVRELRKIDSDLRVVFGYARYLKKQWAIERRIPPERYFLAYESLFVGDGPRFVDQPVFDVDTLEYNEVGEAVGYKQVGTRKYDLAPEYEWVMFAEHLNGEVLTEMKRIYAWERNHPLSRRAFEKVQQDELERKAAAAKAKRCDAALDGLDEALLETRKRVQFGYGDTRNER